jgi:hypothetical protein
VFGAGGDKGCQARAARVPFSGATGWEEISTIIPQIFETIEIEWKLSIKKM